MIPSCRQAQATNIDTGRMARTTCSTLVVLILGLVSVIDSWGEPYEVPEEEPAEQVLGPDLVAGPQYRVEDPILHDGYTNVYSLSSPYGRFVARGSTMFVRLRRELTAIADLHERNLAGLTSEAAVQEWITPLKAVGRLASKPRETLVGIPSGISRLIESSKDSLSYEAGPYEDNTVESFAQMSAYKRRIAAHYHVDPYSTNPALQHELDRAAWAHVAGYTTTFALMVVPAPNPLALMLTSLTTVQVLNQALEEQGPSDLYSLSEKKLKAMQIDDELTRQFLTHPSYSPRHKTVIAFALEELTKASHRDRFLGAALNALSEEEALFYQQEAELLLAYSQQKAPIVNIDIVGRIPVGFTEEGTLFCPLAMDHGIWSERTEAAYNRLAKRAAMAGNDAPIEIWLSGTLSQRARVELLQRGVTARENVARELPLIDWKD
ncbi:MAG: hypothetical protein CV088_09940 [Nitrospira sp. LK70]|nr:hypothetical protein [Nitrospira sp. LK70]